MPLLLVLLVSGGSYCLFIDDLVNMTSLSDPMFSPCFLKLSAFPVCFQANPEQKRSTPGIRALCVRMLCRPGVVRPDAVPSTPSHAYTHPMPHAADARQRERTIRAPFGRRGNASRPLHLLRLTPLCEFVRKFAPICFFFDEMPYSKHKRHTKTENQQKMIRKPAKNDKMPCVVG